MCLNMWNSIVFFCVSKGIIMMLEQCLPRRSASLVFLSTSALCHRETTTARTSSDTCHTEGTGEGEHSACFVSRVVGRSNGVFIHISVSLFRWKQFGWAVREKHLRMWRMWDQSITFPSQASLDTTFHTTIQKITWAPWWLFTLRDHKVSLFLWHEILITNFTFAERS